jgi:ABC-type uncharacterized transport system substrate-binding protein
MRKTRMFYGLFLLLGAQLFAQEQLTALQSFYLMKEVFPEMKTVGVMVNDSQVNVDELTGKLERVSAQMGVTIVISRVQSLKDVSAEFKNLTTNYKLDAIWIPQLDDVLSNKVARDYLVKNSVINKIPLVIHDEEWIKEGALLCLYKKEGKTALSVNPQTAKALGVTVPEKYIPQTTFYAAQ